MKKNLLQLIGWYVLHFSFPHRGRKYFEHLLRLFGLYETTLIKKLPNKLLLSVSANDHIEKYLLWYSYYEKKEVLTFQSFIADNSIVADIGANIGYYSLMGAVKCTKGMMYSFEPSTRNRMKLQNNIELNQFQHIKIIPEAVSNISGNAVMFISNNDNSGMSGLKAADNFSGVIESVSCIAFDEAMRKYNIPKVDVLKIDVEGAEMKVLQGMNHTLLLYQPVIFIEISSATLLMYNEKIDSIYQFLMAKNYQPYRISNINILKKITAPEDGDLVCFLPSSFVVPSGVSIT